MILSRIARCDLTKKAFILMILLKNSLLSCTKKFQKAVKSRCCQKPVQKGPTQMADFQGQKFDVLTLFVDFFVVHAISKALQ